MLEQDIANWLLTTHAAHRALNWSTLPTTLATAALAEVAPTSTVVFHAAGVTGADKFALLRAASERVAGTEASGDRQAVLPLEPCDSHLVC